MDNLNSGRELLSLLQNASGSCKSTCVLNTCTSYGWSLWINAHETSVSITDQRKIRIIKIQNCLLIRKAMDN